MFIARRISPLGSSWKIWRQHSVLATRDCRLKKLSSAQRRANSTSLRPFLHRAGRPASQLLTHARWKRSAEPGSDAGATVSRNERPPSATRPRAFDAAGAGGRLGKSASPSAVTPWLQRWPSAPARPEATTPPLPPPPPSPERLDFTPAPAPARALKPAVVLMAPTPGLAAVPADAPRAGKLS